MRSPLAALLVISLAAVGTARGGTLVERAQPVPARSPSSEAERGCALGGAPTLGENNSAKSLSDRLAQSKGVICPPRDVDPQMTAPPPAEGNTPIIPPPDVPGGVPRAQPR